MPRVHSLQSNLTLAKKQERRDKQDADEFDDRRRHAPNARGAEISAANPLRGHTAADHGRYGRAPTGTDFVLVNTNIERHLATLPLFNTVNIPFIGVNWEVFFDGAKTWDRNRIFQQGKLLLDGKPDELVASHNSGTLERLFTQLTGGTELERRAEDFAKTFRS